MSRPLETGCSVESETGRVIAVVYAGSVYDPSSDFGGQRGVTDGRTILQCNNNSEVRPMGNSMGAYLVKLELANVSGSTLGLWRTFKEETGYRSVKWPDSQQGVETGTACEKCQMPRALR